MFTNRELFFKLKKYNDLNFKHKISDSEIYQVLISINKYKDYTELVNNFDNESKNYLKIKRCIKEIVDGVPIQYVLESCSFCDLDLFVNNNVLIPRPETEGLVKRTIEIINNNKMKHDTIADICCGSGCISFALKKAFPNSFVYASDFYQDAINVTKRNKEKLKLDIDIIKDDKLEGIKKLDIKLDVLISNPPYVENADDIEENVKEYEPIHAIYSKDGTYFYESYFKEYKKVMNKKFLMAFEINYDQEIKLKKLILKYFKDVKYKYTFEKDIYGKTRYLFIIGGE